MKKSYFIFLFFVLGQVFLLAQSQHVWIENQLKLIHQLDDNNLSQKEVNLLLKKQEKLYNQTLVQLLLHKGDFANLSFSYERNIFSLKKAMNVNKKRRNNYAFLRDEVQIKFYQQLSLQNKMIRDIFDALDKTPNIQEFENQMYTLFTKTETKINALNTTDYHPYLKKVDNNSIFKKLQKNIKDYYGLREINFDILRYFTASEKKIYRYNKYEHYNILPPILWVEHHTFIQKLNKKINPYGLDMTKIILIILIILIIYLLCLISRRSIKILLLKQEFFKNYIDEVLKVILFPSRAIFLLIALQLSIYIYNDFNQIQHLGDFFNIIYTFFLTILNYKMLNIITSIQVENIYHTKKKIKNELFNITIKIIKFLVILIGILIMLYFSGVNLTAVLSGLGIGGLAVALAAKETFSAFFATLSLLISDMFSQGDLIESNGEMGTIVEIGLRTTTIRTKNNALISIPNTRLANEDVKNWSKRVVGRRIDMTLGLLYSSSSSNLQNAISHIREMLQNHPNIATEKTNYQEYKQKSIRLVSKEDALGIKKSLTVHLSEFSNSSIDVSISCFTKTTDWVEWLEIKEDIMYKIIDILEKNNLEFAFPTISVDRIVQEK